MRFSILTVVFLLQSTEGFTPPSHRTASRPQTSTRLSATSNVWKKAKKAIQPAALAIGLAFSTSIKPVEASAPVMALPKAEGRDPATEALTEMERRQIKKTQDELNEMARQAREIEKTQGGRARDNFEKEFKQKQQQRAEDKKKGLEQLKRDLLDQGIDPFVDIEGRRQCILFEKGVDLGEVQGTQFNLEKEWERRSPKKSMKVKKASNRKMVALMVQDLKNRDIDPLNYFEKHQDQTQAVLNLPEASVIPLLQKYEANLANYGQIVPPKEGEMSAKEKMAKKGSSPEAKKKAKEEERRKKAELKAKQKEERERARAEAKAAKEAAKQTAKEEKEKSKAAAAAAAAGAVGAATAASGAADTLQDAADSFTGSEAMPEEMSAVEKKDPSGVKSASDKSLVTGVVLVGGGGVAAYGLYRKRQESIWEEERQRQFKLLMGEDSDKKLKPFQAVINGDLDDEEEDDEDFELDEPASSKAKPTDSAASAPAPLTPPGSAPTQKRGLGLKKMFGKKTSRETDLSNLLSPDSPAPEFSTLLAKLLTYGAPGRFPTVEKLPGGKPMDSFDLEAAKEKLIDAREKSDLSDEEGAEIFANVVNCMLIDIVDLASTSLKEKEESRTVDAINIVVDFMNHAASMYDAVAGDVVIKPVVYEGSLGKSKLEKMYSTYAVSGMMNMGDMSDDFDSRVGLLQDVFSISEKKAEGLMMKAVQKNMMKMLKDGKGMEGMEDMLKGMGGMGGLEGLAGMEDGDGPSPEQLKEMLLALKEMKDSGSIPDNELEEVKNQFKEAFGSSIDDVMKDANENDGELSEGDKELLDLMKSILG